MHFFTTFSPNFSIPGTSALPWILPGNSLALCSDAIVTRGRVIFASWLKAIDFLGGERTICLTFGVRRRS